LRKYDAAVSSYRYEVMKTHSYLPCKELHSIQVKVNKHYLVRILVTALSK